MPGRIYAEIFEIATEQYGYITATDAVVTTTAILKAVNVQLFELGMWQAWSGR